MGRCDWGPRVRSGGSHSTLRWNHDAPIATLNPHTRTLLEKKPTSFSRSVSRAWKVRMWASRSLIRWSWTAMKASAFSNLSALLKSGSGTSTEPEPGGDGGTSPGRAYGSPGKVAAWPGDARRQEARNAARTGRAGRPVLFLETR